MGDITANIPSLAHLANEDACHYEADETERVGAITASIPRLADLVRGVCT